ncbi:MAG: substrate-binding domain-containing protein [Oscillospiraceae bacterium]|nr:substrate-binding domain-containing protein [Oscillospiraceae bacterium]
MKKLIAILSLICMIAICFTGCGGKEEPSEPVLGTTTAKATTAATEAPTQPTDDPVQTEEPTETTADDPAEEPTASETVTQANATVAVTTKAPAAATTKAPTAAPTTAPTVAPKQGNEYKVLPTLSGTVSFSGSTSVYPAIAALREAFLKMYPKVSIQINNVTGSGAGLADARNGKVSFGMRSSVFNGSGDDNGTLNGFIMAWDGVAIVVKPDTFTKLGGTISMQELAYVYEGKEKSGYTVDPARKAALDSLNPVNREDGSGTRTCFIDMLKGTYTVGSSMAFKAGIPISSTTDQMGTMVINTANGIGYMSLGSVPNNLKALSVSKTGTGAIEANSNTVLNGSYPFSRPFVLLRLKTKTLNVAEKEFLNFIYSDKGQEIVANAHFEMMSTPQITTEKAKYN